jgi:hypothetical protein
VPSSLSSGLYKIHRLAVDIAVYQNDQVGVPQCGFTEAGYTPAELQFSAEPGAPKSLRFVVDVSALLAANPPNCPDSNHSAILQIVK